MGALLIGDNMRSSFKLVSLVLLTYFMVATVNPVSGATVWDNSITQSYSFDGANYRMITKYGDYVFLSPGYIMEYWALNGEKMIDKSMWILQHDTGSSWEALENFANIDYSVNDTSYIFSYDVTDGDNILASVSIEFYSSGYSMNKPKLIINMVKHENWDLLGYGSFRWLYDIIPTSDHLKVIKNNQVIADISNEDYNGMIRNIAFGEIDRYAVFDTSDFFYDYELIPDPLNRSLGEGWTSGLAKNYTQKQYESVEVFGGSDPYWNSKGFIIIYPVNESYIDPYTVVEDAETYSTAHEQNERTFKNPDGQGWFYSLVGNSSDNLIYTYKSQNGTSWEPCSSTAPYSFKLGTSVYTQSWDAVMFRNQYDNITLLEIAYTRINSWGLQSKMYQIYDNETDIRHKADGFWYGPLDDGMWYPDVEVDRNNHVWYVFSEEYWRDGHQRHYGFVMHSRWPDSPSAGSGAEGVYHGDDYTEDMDFIGRWEIVPVNRTWPNIAEDYEMMVNTVFSLDNNATGNYGIYSVQFGYNVTALPNLSDEYSYSGDDMNGLHWHTGVEIIEADVPKIQNPVVFSAWTQANHSDLYVLHIPSNGNDLQIDVSDPVLNTTQDNWADIHSYGAISETYQLSFYNGLDEIIVFWANVSASQNNTIFISRLNISIPVPEIVGNFTDTANTVLHYLSAMQTEGYNGTDPVIHLIATNATTNIRSYLYQVGEGEAPPATPLGEYEYPDRDTSNIDSSGDLGDLIDFDNLTGPPDSIYTLLNETQHIVASLTDFIDVNTSNVDGVAGYGEHSNFENMKTVDGMDTLTEENTGGAGGGFPSLRSGTRSRETGNTQNHDVSMPSTIEAGDTIIVAFVNDDNENVGFPGGGTILYEEDAGSAGPTLTIAWREADGTEDGTTITVTTGTNEKSVHFAWAIQDADDPDTNPPEVSAEASGSSQYPNPNNLAPTGGSDSYMWIAVYGCDDDDMASVYPTNYDDNQDTWESSTGSGTCGGGLASYEYEGTNQNPNSFTISSEQWEACVIAIYPTSGGGANYTLNLETQFQTVNTTYEKLELAIRTGTQDAEDLNVSIWDGASWDLLFNGLTTSAWNNRTITSYDNATITLRFLDADQTDDTDQGTWEIDAVMLLPYNDSMRLDQEISWDENRNFTDYADLCINTGTMDPEDLEVYIWNKTATAWALMFSDLTASAWNNISIKDYLIDDQDVYVRFLDDNQTIQDEESASWFLDSVLIHTYNITAYVVVVTHTSLNVNESQVNDFERFYLNITIDIQDDTANFTRNILTIDPSGLALNVTYLNGTGFSELYDPNNYLTLDASESNKTDIDPTQFYLMYVLDIHVNITKEAWFDVRSFSNESYQGANDTDTYSNVFNLTLRGPDAVPDSLFGAGFNASAPHIEIYWTYSGGLADDYEVHNSTDGAVWDALATPTDAWYNDTSVGLLNGTYRYHRVRARRSTGVGYKNSSWTPSNFEQVYFIKSAGAVGPGGETVYIEVPGVDWLPIALILGASMLFLGSRTKR